MDYKDISDSELTEIIYEGLYKRFSDKGHWIYSREVPLKTGFSGTRIDAVTMSCYESENYRIDGYEVKASQSDLKVELINPSKHQRTYDCVDYFWLVTAPHVISGLYDELPKKWGVMLLKDDGSLRVRRKALALEDNVDSTVKREFIASFVRKSFFYGGSDDRVEQVRKESFELGRQSVLKLNESLGKISELLDIIHSIDDSLGIYHGSDKEKILYEIERLKERAIADPKWILNKIDDIQSSLKEFNSYVKDFKKKMPVNSDNSRRWY